MGQLQACGEPTVSGGQCGGSRRGQIKLERRNEHAGQQQSSSAVMACRCSDAASQRQRRRAKEHFALMTRRPARGVDMGRAVGNWSVRLGLAGLLARRQAEAATATKAFVAREPARWIAGEASPATPRRCGSAGRSAPKRALQFSRLPSPCVRCWVARDRLRLSAASSALGRNRWPLVLASSCHFLPIPAIPGRARASGGEMYRPQTPPPPSMPHL